MSLTIISWCQKVHDVPFSVGPPDPNTGQAPIAISPYPCDPRNWIGGTVTKPPDAPYASGNSGALCMPRWAIWGYQDRRSKGWSQYFWVGPAIAPSPTGGGGSATMVYSYGGVDILAVNGEMISMGVVPHYSGGDIIGYAVSIGVPPQWAGTLVSKQIGFAPNITYYGYYTVWDLPTDLLVKDPIWWGGGPEGLQYGAIYGFAYDGPIAKDAQGNVLSLQTVSIAVNNPFLISRYSSDPIAQVYFYAKTAASA